MSSTYRKPGRGGSSRGRSWRRLSVDHLLLCPCKQSQRKDFKTTGKTENNRKKNNIFFTTVCQTGDINLIPDKSVLDVHVL